MRRKAVLQGYSLLSRHLHIAIPRSQQAGVTVPAGSPFERYLAGLRRDSQIDTSQVRVRGPDGLSESQTLRGLLRGIDSRRQTVIQLSKPGEHEVAIVELVTFDKLREQLRARDIAEKEKRAEQREKKTKQIELNWAIGSNDLQMKMKQMEGFLSEGKKVEILLAPKRHARRATVEEAEKVMKLIGEKLEEVDARAVSKDGQLLKQVTMTVRKKDHS